MSRRRPHMSRISDGPLGYGYDRRLTEIMCDTRFYGDLNSQALPFSVKKVSPATLVSPAAPMTRSMEPHVRQNPLQRGSVFTHNGNATVITVQKDQQSSAHSSVTTTRPANQQLNFYSANTRSAAVNARPLPLSSSHTPYHYKMVDPGSRSRDATLKGNQHATHKTQKRQTTGAQTIPFHILKPPTPTRQLPSTQMLPAQDNFPKVALDSSSFSAEGRPVNKALQVFAEVKGEHSKQLQEELVAMSEQIKHHYEQSLDEAANEAGRQFEQGKAAARRDMESEVYHAYTDSTGFSYHDVTLTRINVATNVNERVCLALYESDFSPHNYVTHVAVFGPGAAFRSEILANGVDYATAFLAFRRAFKTYTRVSWEARHIPQAYIAEHVQAWERSCRQRLLLEKTGELCDDDSIVVQTSTTKPNPARARGTKKRAAPHRTDDDDGGDVLTKPDLDSCRIKRFKYTLPAGEATGELPQLGTRFPVIPGDDPGDGGWTLVVPVD